jgi:DNA (cytosine-5)-methyltransferase 1
MSSAQSNRGLADDADAGSRDKRNLLVEVVAAVAEELEPRLVVVENVVPFLTRKVRHPQTGQAIAAARLLVDRLADHYHPFSIRTDLADYGVAQSRKRAFVVLVRKTEPGLAKLLGAERAPFPAATHGGDGCPAHVTLKEALADLSAGSLDSRSAETAGSGLHSVPVWNERRYQMVASIPSGTGQSAWANDVCPSCGKVSVTDDDATCPICGQGLFRPVVEEDGAWRLIKGFRNSSYRRMAPGRPAAAVTTASGRIGSDNTLHPTENRVLSMLECQHLQTIPADFKWGNHLDLYGHTSLRQMIGEAVPPQFTEMHGRLLASLLDGRLPRNAMTFSDARLATAHRRLGLPGGKRARKTAEARRSERPSADATRMLRSA